MDIKFTDQPTHRGYIYSKDILVKAFGEKPILYGYLNKGCPNIIPEMSDLALKVTGFSEIENGIVVETDILNTPAGNILSKLIDNKANISFGINGVGTKDGNIVKTCNIGHIDIFINEMDRMSELEGEK